MKILSKLFVSVLLLTSQISFAADQIDVPLNSGKSYFTDTNGNLMPMMIGYTTDWNGHLQLLQPGGGGTDDDLYFPKNSGNMFMKGLDGNFYPAMVIYTTDGNGHVQPIDLSGGGGGGGSWGSITGTLSDQTDLQSALDAKMILSGNPDVHPNGNSGGFQYSNHNIQIKPLQNSPDESWSLYNRQVNIDPDSTGFSLGTNGTFGSIFNIGYSHNGISDIGNTQYFNTYSNFGNGTDPFNMKGFQYFLGYGNVNSGVTITDSLQGFGMQWNVNSGATFGPSSYFNGFYDNMNVNTAVNSYTSFTANPHLAEIRNNFSGIAFNLYPTVDKLTGNATYFGFVMNGDYGASGMGANAGVEGININPTIHNFGSGNYFNGVYSSTLNISGAGTNKWAGYFEGNVHINGDLSFTGGLSIGKLNAFATQAVTDGGANPQSVHMMISNMTIPSSATIANADTIGLNTAALIQVGDNATVTSGGFGIGLVGLALPAVIETGTGSSVDYIGGAAFALNFSGTSTGGTVNQGYGGMFLPVPNGITTINRWYGVWSKMPFGGGTSNWSGYFQDAPVYSEEGIVVGSSDTFSQSHFGIESEKTIASANGLQLATSGSQLSCDASHRGLIWNVEGGAGVADSLQVCQKDSSDAYVWTAY